MQVKCKLCGLNCVKNGKTSAGVQRWYCKQCKSSTIRTIDNTAKRLNFFLKWLFGKKTQAEMTESARSFRRKTKEFWVYWPMPPKIEEPKEVLYVDGIYLAAKACILICYDGESVLGWYLCRTENARAWEALMQRIAAPTVVVTDGGRGFLKAKKSVWPKTKIQRCTFHAFCQVRRYTTRNPRTTAGYELYILAKDLLYIKSQEEAVHWMKRLLEWPIKYRAFLAEMSRDSNGTLRPTHERLIKANHSLITIMKQDAMFTYLKDTLDLTTQSCPATNNAIEGGVNAQLRALLRQHRGLSIKRRIKAVFWWCYMHSPQPLSASEILSTMPTDESISSIYKKMNERAQLESSIPSWGDAIVWSDLHNYDKFIVNDWD